MTTRVTTNVIWRGSSTADTPRDNGDRCPATGSSGRRRAPHHHLSDGTPLIKGKKVTGFSNEEERLAELDKYVPFLTEAELMKRGAIYKKADKPWASFAVADGRVITGQNPASGGAVAGLVLAALMNRA